LSWEEVQACDGSLIEFGSHGRSHQILTRMAIDEARDELLTSRQLIEERLGRKVVSFAYPNGDYSGEIKRLARQAGYEYALAIHPSREETAARDIFALPRRGVHEGVCRGAGGGFSPALFAAFLEGIF
jgi:peptidoglycan/xylan/chitin deacetylase (PgdA/CDA1 family)